MPDTLTRTFAALADPTRRAIVARLARGEATVNDLAAPFLERMSLPAVTKHIQVLERAGLVSKSVAAQYRPCRLNRRAFREMADWMERYRAFWEESFDRLEEHLRNVTKESAKTKRGKKHVRKKRSQ